MSKRRSHSSIDNLPDSLRAVLTRMIVDHDWPADWVGEREGNPRYDDCALYCATQGHAISKSAVGRWAKGLRAIEIMKTAGLVLGTAMADMTGEDAPTTQKGAAQMMTALTLDFMVSHENLSAKEMKDVAQTIRDCAQVAIKADTYIRQQIGERVEKTAKSTKAKLTKAGVDRKLIQEIIDEHLGVVKQ